MFVQNKQRLFANLKRVMNEETVACHLGVEVFHGHRKTNEEE